MFLGIAEFYITSSYREDTCITTKKCKFLSVCLLILRVRNRHEQLRNISIYVVGLYIIYLSHNTTLKCW